MGTLSFSVGQSNSYETLVSTQVTTSGAFTTSGTAAFVEDASGDITLSAGQIFQAHASEAMRIVFGGQTATTSTGHYLPAGIQSQFLVREAGKVSAIDVA